MQPISPQFQLVFQVLFEPLPTTFMLPCSVQSEGAHSSSGGSSSGFILNSFVTSASPLAHHFVVTLLQGTNALFTRRLCDAGLCPLQVSSSPSFCSRFFRGRPHFFLFCYICFVCDCCKELTRARVFVCAGHSTNFIMHHPLPCTEHPTKWVKRGLALLCQLDD